MDEDAPIIGMGSPNETATSATNAFRLTPTVPPPPPRISLLVGLFVPS